MLPLYNESFHGTLRLIGQFIPKILREPLELLATQLVSYLGDYAGELTSAANVFNAPVGNEARSTLFPLKQDFVT